MEAGLEIQRQGSGPHSTTVPWIWKKGRPMLVCQFWGDLRMRLLRVSRLPGDGARVSSGGDGGRAGRIGRTSWCSGRRRRRGSGLRTARGKREAVPVKCEAGAKGLVQAGGGRTGHGVVLGVVLQLLGRDGRAEEVLQVLEHVLLGGRERARLRVVVEVGHAGTAETFLLGYGREVAHRLAERTRPCLPNVVTRFAYGF